MKEKLKMKLSIIMKDENPDTYCKVIKAIEDSE